MRIPPYYRRPGWQRFFAGFFLGVITGWVFFLLQFGSIHEQLVVDLRKQEVTINHQREQIELLRSEEQKLNEENQRKLTVQEIDVHFTNKEESRLNELSLYELQQQAIDELKFLKNKSIESVIETKELMERTIENKRFNVGDHSYQLTIEQIYLYTTLEMYVSITAVNGTS